jgi:hypothetical protein
MLRCCAKVENEEQVTCLTAVDGLTGLCRGYRIYTVADFKRLAAAAAVDAHYQRKLLKYLNLHPDSWKAARDLADSAVGVRARLTGVQVLLSRLGASVFASMCISWEMSTSLVCYITITSNAIMYMCTAWQRLGLEQRRPVRLCGGWVTADVETGNC